jgi:hypothetical protein
MPRTTRTIDKEFYQARILDEPTTARVYAFLKLAAWKAVHRSPSCGRFGSKASPNTERGLQAREKVRKCWSCVGEMGWSEIVGSNNTRS